MPHAIFFQKMDPAAFVLALSSNELRARTIVLRPDRPRFFGKF